MKINFFNIPLDAISMKETINRIDIAIRKKKKISHGAINAHILILMQKDQELVNSVTSCDIILADGQSIVWAARFLGYKIPERVAGIDLMHALVKLAHEKKYKCFFLGAKEEVVRKVIEIYSGKYGPAIIAGYKNGYFTKQEEPDIAKQISDSGAQLLFVAMTSPKKENFLFHNKNLLKNINFTMGVGGTFDVIAGITKRAPKWMQKIGMEWFYRFLQEPKRMWRRYLFGNAKFIWMVLKEKMKIKNLKSKATNKQKRITLK